MNSELLRKESPAQFDARIEQENRESITVACPLPSCGAEIGEHCCTEAGQPRIRHCRRLMEARKQNEQA